LHYRRAQRRYYRAVPQECHAHLPTARVRSRLLKPRKPSYLGTSVQLPRTDYRTAPVARQGGKRWRADRFSPRRPPDAPLRFCATARRSTCAARLGRARGWVAESDGGPRSVVHEARPRAPCTNLSLALLSGRRHNSELRVVEDLGGQIVHRVTLGDCRTPSSLPSPSSTFAAGVFAGVESTRRRSRKSRSSDQRPGRDLFNLERPRRRYLPRAENSPSRV